MLPPENVTDWSLLLYLDALSATIAALENMPQPVTPQVFLQVLADRLDMKLSERSVHDAENQEQSDLHALLACQMRDRVARTVRIYQVGLP